ncbi:hypothetical protein HHI36_009935 [Cryptolaemus montrouzieri]|uniref:Uncharacterized protein n=1 Tax=Cryptolaemus montrouzieri TaxID=559131 RepID=A0ABD2MHA7_9CUCU
MPSPPLSRAQRIISMCAIPAPPSRNNEDASAYFGDVISQDLGMIGIAMEEEITMTNKNNDSEFVDNTDECTDENIDEDIEKQHYGNRDMIVNEEVTMREEIIVEECVEHINEDINANIDVNIDEQHFRNQKIILNECTGIFDIVKDSSSLQVEKMDETIPTKYNKKNNQKL